MNPEFSNISKLVEAIGTRTVKELASDTSNIALPTLVSARVAIQLATLVDARPICRIEPIGPGEGITHYFQTVTVPATNWEQTLTENSNLTARDATLAGPYATILTKAVRTQISDLVARQSAWNTINVMGAAHGNGLNRAINALIYAQVITATTTNPVATGTASDAKSTNYTYANLLESLGAVEDQRFRPNVFLTYPYQAAKGSGGAATGFYPFINSNITSVQFTSALQSFVSTGRISELFGLQLYVDSLFKPTTASADGAVMGAVMQRDESIGWCQAGDVVSEMQRWAPMVGFEMVTSVTGASKIIMEPSVSLLRHAV